MEGKRLTSYAMEELECPKCGHKHSLKKYKVINVTEKAKLKEEIIKEKAKKQYTITAILEDGTAYI